MRATSRSTRRSAVWSEPSRCTSPATSSPKLASSVSSRRSASLTTSCTTDAVASRPSIARPIATICVCTCVSSACTSPAISLSSLIAPCRAASASEAVSRASSSFLDAVSCLWLTTAIVLDNVTFCSLSISCLASISASAVSAFWWRSSASACCALRAASTFFHSRFSPSSSPTCERSASAACLARTTCCAHSVEKTTAALRFFSISTLCRALSSVIASFVFSTCEVACFSDIAATASACACLSVSARSPAARSSTDCSLSCSLAATCSACSLARPTAMTDGRRADEAGMPAGSGAAGSDACCCEALPWLAYASASSSSISASERCRALVWASARWYLALSPERLSRRLCTSFSFTVSLSLSAAICVDASAIATPCECASSDSALRSACTSFSSV
mmetsp:Transcript_9326/g.24119  ORF Transcript_9326/g.24119 Transcript_9326/m.24119 type:complete len:395 (+) Transcript_9326:109-1293(+)